MIVGFVGKKGSGKSTAAKFLEEEHGFCRHNFKDALIAELKHKMPETLREMVHAVALVSDGEWTVDRLFAEKPPIARALLQNYGTDVRRADDPEYWVDLWRNFALVPDNKNIVVDDVRFENEAQAIRDMGGCLIRIMKNSPVVTEQDNHPSETEQDDIVVNHEIVVEKGDLKTLKERVFRAVFVE